MAHYFIDPSKSLGSQVRAGLQQMRDGKFKLDCAVGIMNQMTSQQISLAGVGADATEAAAALSELASDIGKLNSDASQTSVHAATEQMFNQFG